MSRYQLTISPAARNDLENIYRSSQQRWGKLQAVDYLNHLKNHLWRLTQHPDIGVSRPDLQPGTRSLVLKTHIVFYRIRAENIEIIRVLHTRQNPNLHIECSSL